MPTDRSTHSGHRGALPPPPGAWAPARGLARRAFAPVERFLAIETASSVLLIAVSAIALLWANSMFAYAYIQLWHTSIGLHVGGWHFERDLHFWINEGLMTIFFFVVGLEIRREIHHGELSQLRRAALPIVAALGGMTVPALLYVAVNYGQPSIHGWSVPMATDIAFAVGILALLGKRVPNALRVSLLAVAVIDDVGAILVIAFLYSAGFAPGGFGIVAAGIAGILGMQSVGIRSPWAYVVPGVVLWAGALASGIHPTLAGVVVGLLTPARAWIGGSGFVETTEATIATIRERQDSDGAVLLPHLDQINAARREAVAPAERLVHALHGLVAFGIMPLFAFANAGVPLGNADFDDAGLRVFLGICAGLVLGKPLGIVAAAWLATRAGITTMPEGLTWSRYGIVGMAAGIGFTMALFIAQLAFPPGPLLETAKLAILFASTVAALVAYVLGLFVLPVATTDLTQAPEAFPAAKPQA